MVCLFTERITVLLDFVGGPGAETWTSELDRIGLDRSHFVRTGTDWTAIAMRLDWNSMQVQDSMRCPMPRENESNQLESIRTSDGNNDGK